MNIVFLFPGQGAQYPGMGKDFVESYPVARQIFEEADDILQRNLSKIILSGPEDELTETKNSQTGIYVTSYAILKTLEQLFPEIKPTICAGLSLGEYTAVTAAKFLSFQEGLILVQHRGQYMNDACEATKGTMAVILGMTAEAVESLVREINMPNDLWAANFNCPGQVVISGTDRGIEIATSVAKERGAKRVLPLQVHGAFHSGLMKSAQLRLAPYINAVKMNQGFGTFGFAKLVMNVPGAIVTDEGAIRQNLIDQVTQSVRWEQGISAIELTQPNLYVEIGPGKTLSGFNKRIGVKAPTVSIESVNDLVNLEKFVK